MTESIRREFIENASEIGIDLNDKMLSSFDIYYKNLLEWNAVMNLTAVARSRAKEADYHRIEGALLHLAGKAGIYGKKNNDMAD